MSDTDSDYEFDPYATSQSDYGSMLLDLDSDLDSDSDRCQNQNQGHESNDSSSTPPYGSEITMYDNVKDVKRYNLLYDLTPSTEPVEGLGDEIGHGVPSIPVDSQLHNQEPKCS